MDFNVYWLLKEDDSKNLKYAIKNFSPKRFYVRNINGSRPTIVDESLERKVLSFKKTKEGFSFFADKEKIYNFNDDKKGFSLRYRLDEKEYTVLTNADYKNGDYIEISFHGKIEVEPAKPERAPGIPFYKIKKS